MSSTVDSWWQLDDQQRLDKLKEQARERREQERQKLREQLLWNDQILVENPARIP